jgi:hypothetical protein
MHNKRAITIGKLGPPVAAFLICQRARELTLVVRRLRCERNGTLSLAHGVSQTDMPDFSVATIMTIQVGERFASLGCNGNS